MPSDFTRNSEHPATFSSGDRERLVRLESDLHHLNGKLDQMTRLLADHYVTTPQLEARIGRMEDKVSLHNKALWTIIGVVSLAIGGVMLRNIGIDPTSTPAPKAVEQRQ